MQLHKQVLGSFAPFLQTASTQAGEAAKQAGLAGQFVGPKAYEDFMSPYQRDVIKATLDEFDEQSRRGLLSRKTEQLQRVLLEE
ncbi:MAG: hypothetical protein CM15mV60_230 [uncultured marine virus]|nr:MAG: hypothetical protein CM15mV60_230 [uncultured marine virus]